MLQLFARKKYNYVEGLTVVYKDEKGNVKEDEWLITDLKLEDLSDYHDIDLVIEKIDLKKFFD